MARVTVEDCVVKVPNRFELVLLAAQRAREITSGAPLTLDRDDDKNPVVALREIADETVALAHLRDAVVRGMQKHVEIDEPEETPELEVDPSVFGVAPPAGSLLDDPDSTRRCSRRIKRRVTTKPSTRRSSPKTCSGLDEEDEVDLADAPAGEAAPDDLDEEP